ncbi:MAG: tRNA-dihydrouridine synthase [Clostridium sp.]
MKLRIGNVELENNLILAPMAGVTDMSFRQLCREQGCGLLVTEMVSAKAILYKNRNTKELMAIGEGERPVSLQLFGSDPKSSVTLPAGWEETVAANDHRSERWDVRCQRLSETVRALP